MYCNSIEVMFRYNVSLVLQFCRGYISLECVSCIAVLKCLYFATVCLSYCSSIDVIFRHSVSLVLQFSRDYVSLQCVSCIAVL